MWLKVPEPDTCSDNDLPAGSQPASFVGVKQSSITTCPALIIDRNVAESYCAYGLYMSPGSSRYTNLSSVTTARVHVSAQICELTVAHKRSISQESL